MGITLSHRSALESLRAARVRGGSKGASCAQTDLVNPDLDGNRRWTSQLVADLKGIAGLPRTQHVDVIVREAKRRIRHDDIVCHVWSGANKSGLLFAELDNGITIPCPEILLLQMAETLSPPEVIALGHELCGRYTLRESISAGQAVTGLPPVTTPDQIAQVLKSCKGLRGAAVLRDALPYIRENAASPMETCLSAIVQLPLRRYGYQLGDVILNKTVRPEEGLSPFMLAASRTPDLLFVGTTVGLNYDGDVHLDLSSVVSAARALTSNPRDTARAMALDTALDNARKSAANDKQRDRDLLAMGYTVLPVTKYDLQDIEVFDKVMGQVISIIERTTGRDLSLQKRGLEDPMLRKGREQLLRLLNR